MSFASTSLIFKYGKPVMAKHVEASTHSAGDVVVIGATPFVAHTDVPAYTGGTLTDALACEGGVYTGLSDGTPVIGQPVYWNASTKKFTATAAGNTHFGTCVGGPAFDGLAGSGPASDGDACDVLHAPNRKGGVGLVFSAAAASTAVSNTTAETTFDNSSYTIAANTLQPGDVIRVRLQGIATATNSTDTLNVKLKIGSTVVAATGAVDVANNDIGVIDADVVVRTIGASGTLVAAGTTSLGASGTATAKVFNLASTTIDTTASNVVSASATWSVASSSNSCRLDVMDVQLLRK